MMLGFVAQGLKTFPQGGIHPEENKLSAARPIEAAPLPQTVVIPLSQHIGAPAKPVVNQRDKVKVGQLIAQGEGFVSANIHATVSGTVTKSTNTSTAPATSATPS
jgi:Na+-translocating ferredoxin:NAD+ oxidoreductase subunit C